VTDLNLVQDISLKYVEVRYFNYLSKFTFWLLWNIPVHTKWP